MLKSGRGGAGGGSLVSHVLTIGRLNALGINNTAPFQSVFSQDSPISLRFSPAIFCRGASSARLHGMNRSNVQLCWFKFTRFQATETSILSRTEPTKSVLSIWNARSTILLYYVGWGHTYCNSSQASFFFVSNTLWWYIIWTLSREAGGIPWVSAIFTLSVEQADARRDGRTCLARPNSQARTATGNSTRLYGVNQMLNFVDSSSHASGLRKLASCREPTSQNPYYQYEMRGPL